MREDESYHEFNYSFVEQAAPYAAAGHEDEMPHLIPFIQPDSESAVIVCPGGGYGHLADHEGAPIAEMLNAAGISAFVLKYRVAPHRHPAPQADGQRAIRYVRANAEQYGINPSKIAVLGFRPAVISQLLWARSMMTGNRTMRIGSNGKLPSRPRDSLLSCNYDAILRS